MGFKSRGARTASAAGEGSIAALASLTKPSINAAQPSGNDKSSAALAAAAAAATAALLAATLLSAVMELLSLSVSSTSVASATTCARLPPLLSANRLSTVQRQQRPRSTRSRPIHSSPSLHLCLMPVKMITPASRKLHLWGLSHSHLRLVR